MGASASVETISLSPEALAKVCDNFAQPSGNGLFFQLHTETQVAEQEELPSIVAETVRRNEIDGSTLNELTPEDVDALAENNLDRKKLRGALNRR